MTDKRRGKKTIDALPPMAAPSTSGDQLVSEVSETLPAAGAGPEKFKSGRVIRIDGESCPVVHAHMIVLTRSSNRGSTRVILF